MTQNYTAFILPFIVSLFDFITLMMLFHSLCVCLCVHRQTSRDIHQCRFYVGGHRNIFPLSASGDSKQTASQIPPLDLHSLETKNKSIVGKTSPTRLAPLELHPKSNSVFEKASVYSPFTRIHFN